ncbi:FG-GAP-like repeat-containing protein [Streptomyces sp. FIT100]|uniref:FG-GAP-like repeat-containing protein n=1 Tax=Streptomyces sp. FIT100 TaxID=2837956 RepID=UPI0021C693C9|nr:FG-GAP-like repeat-containing protein [Streptomyces sp. FIT100]UUN28104.1 VCBS repeat-containing protein [Streptomyces sp. FIT100]
MSSRRFRTAWVTGLTAAAVTGGLMSPAPAGAVAGPVAADGYAFTAKVLVGDGAPVRGCSGALVSREWIVTAASCFADDPAQVRAGRPEQKTTVIVDRADLFADGAHTSEIAELVPAKGRDVVMARLASYAPVDVAPVALADTPLAAGDEATFAGLGRTGTEWAPNKVHTAAFKVDSVTDTTLFISGKTRTDSACQGDSGGPLLRETDNGTELVGIGIRSWHGGCLGESDTRTNAQAVRTDDLVEWMSATVNQTWARQLAAGDFTGDGKTDAIAIDKNDNKLHAHPGDGKGGFTGRRQIGVQWDTSRVITAGDFTGDNKSDIVAIRDNGVLLTYPGNGAGGFGTAVTAGTGWNSMRLLAVGDFTGDKKTDLLAVHDDGTLYIYPGTADGKVGRGIVAGAGWSGIRLIAGGDFNGDGRADATAVHDNGTLFSYTNNGKNGFNPGTAVGSGWKSTRLITGGDFDGDGKADLLALRGASTFYTYLGNGRGNFSTPVITQP